MKKLQTMKLKLSVAISLLLVAGLIGCGLYVKAYSNEGPKVVVEGNYIEAQQIKEEKAAAEMLGALTSPDIASNYLCVNGNCTYNLVQSFPDCSTTLASMPDPFLTTTSTYTPASPLLWGDTSFGMVGATSTVTRIAVTITAPATTTIRIWCGSSATPMATSSGTYYMMRTGDIASSSIGVFENGVTSTMTLGVTDELGVAKIMLTPDTPYLVCIALPTASTYSVGLTGLNETLVGKVTAEIKRQR